ncbi:ABATE domain-containing protein, partial [Streptomyces zhihengii]
MTAPAPHALVLDFVLTVRHDGRGGVADDLADTAGLAVWIREHADVLGEDARRAPADERTLAAVRDLRAAVRSLFARAVLPGPPCRAGEGRLPPAAGATAPGNA